MGGNKKRYLVTVKLLFHFCVKGKKNILKILTKKGKRQETFLQNGNVFSFFS